MNKNQKIEAIENRLKIKRNTVVHCETLELENKVLKIYNRLNLTDIERDLWYDNSHWDKYKKETCYNLFTGNFASVEFYMENGYDIMTAEDFIDIHKMN